jgi:hypothetical protein
MATHQGQLPIPDAAITDARAIELVRVWAAGGKQHVSLATQLWKDPATWGLMLVDLARHVANAYAMTGEKTSDSVLQRIKEGFDVEWNANTDETSDRITK